MNGAVIVRGSWWSQLVRAAAPLLVAVTARAAAQTVTEASISPAAPTWRDRTAVTIAGTLPANCIPITPPPDIVALGPRSYRIELPLAMACPPGPLPGSHPFDTSVELPPLEPGSYTLRVTDGGGSTLAERAFEVYDVADAAIEVPAAFAANHPVAVGLTWLAAAGTPAASVEVHGAVVEIHVTSPASFFPPAQLASLDVPLPILAAGRHELRVIFHGHPALPLRLVRSELHVLRPAGCVPDAKTLCLHDGRFRLTAAWRDFGGHTGVAHAAPLDANDESGLLWFFAPDNAELTVKVLDACTISGRWWTFVSSSSTVDYTLTVTDVATGRTRTYGNALGQTPRLVADTDAFACP
jgi:hypothetical protein